MEILTAAILTAGVLLTLVAAIGIVRFPDLYMRMHAATKAGTVGLGLTLLAVALIFRETAVTSRAIGTLLFIGITSPVAAHLLGRAMLRNRYTIWRRR